MRRSGTIDRMSNARDDAELAAIRDGGAWRLAVLSLRVVLIGFASAALAACCGLLGLRGWPFAAWFLLSFALVALGVLGSLVAVVAVTPHTRRYVGLRERSHRFGRGDRVTRAFVGDILRARSIGATKAG